MAHIGMGLLGPALAMAGLHHPNPNVILTDDPPVPTDTKKRPDERGWNALESVEFSDKSVKAYHVDTRDFHVKKSTEGKELDLSKTRKYPYNYFHTAEEVKELLQRLITVTGGKKDWRYFTLKNVFRSEGWNMKYMRIYRFPQGLVVCNQYGFVFNKRDLAQPVVMRR